jgi:hypothetical protein
MGSRANGVAGSPIMRFRPVAFSVRRRLASTLSGTFRRRALALVVRRPDLSVPGQQE